MAVVKVRLFPRAEAAVRSGHPWVFQDSVKSASAGGRAGDLAVAYDRNNRFLALGLWDPGSPLIFRILQTGEGAEINSQWWARRAREARDLRNFGPETTGYRCLNGASERFPGLVADWYENTLVVKIYTAAWLARWDEVEPALREVFVPEFLVLRTARNLERAVKECGFVTGFQGVAGEEIVVFRENGLRFESAVLRGQKTGFFLDQRDNRARVQELAQGRSVLNLFSFSGGFSLYAARGGASAVSDVDISQHALTAGKRNFLLNPDVRTPRREIQADVFEWLAQAKGGWDLVVLDPPSLVKHKQGREKALAAYRRLNAAAIRRLNPGGVLVTASCSAHVSTAEFSALVEDVAAKSGRRWTELWRSGHALDHPARFPEAVYLKAMALEFG